MVTRKQALEVIEKLKQNKPEVMLNEVKRTEKGLGLVLGYIYENPNVYAVNISQKMQISRARIAVILKKLINRGLVKKSPAPDDARVEVLSVTEKGAKEVRLHKEAVVSLITAVIKEVGYDEVNTFISTSFKIREAVRKFEKRKTGKDKKEL